MSGNIIEVLVRAGISVKLHIGCKDRRIPGFINVDIQDGSNVDFVSDAAFFPGIAPGCVDQIYASHILEHFGRHEYPYVLAEWARILRPGGLLRVAVPDFAACVAHYQEHGIGALTGLLHGGQRDKYDYHKIIFDEPMLTKAMEDAGFFDVRRWDWRKTEHAGIDDASQAYLPHMDKENGRHMSLNLEGTRITTKVTTLMVPSECDQAAVAEEVDDADDEEFFQNMQAEVLHSGHSGATRRVLGK